MDSPTLQPLLDVGLLGGFRLTSRGKPVEGVRSPRAQALLVYLLLHRNTPQPRQHLAFLLWPESTERQARTNLRHLLHDLRHQLPEVDRLLHIDAKEIRWADGAIALDVEQFEAHVTQARQAEQEGARARAVEQLERAVQLYRGDLHPAGYEPWLELERAALRDVYLAALERLVRLLSEQEAVAEAIGYATQLVQRNPLGEQGYLALMRLHEAREDHAAVLQVFHQCRATLARELHVEPGPGIQAIQQRVERERIAAASPTPKPSSPAPGNFEHPLVGRGENLARIQECWEQSSRGSPHLVLIAGDPGIGKTRLAEEFLAETIARGIPCARSRCHEAEGRLAWAPVVGWLRSPALRDGIRTLEPVWLGELARILPELRAERSDLPGGGSLATGWGRRNFLEALDRAILAAPPPLVLLLDDIQWADSGTLEWIGHLMRSALRSPLLLIATMRTGAPPDADPVTRLLLELELRDGMTRVSLDPLDLVATTTLASHLSPSAVEDRLARRLHRETEGNPLFIVETIRAGVLDDVAGEDPDHPVPIPAAVHNVIAQRLGRLSPKSRAVSQCMAIIG
ncbi:MAG: 6-hydroxy-D-nicotine oxidase, partial [Betaproteobacteria bacterium HGW-Betaproteobacteria-17]